MRITPWFMAGMVLLSAVAASQTSAEEPSPKFDFEQWRRDQELVERVFTRAYAIRPARRDTPMRELNISDNEVREIQQVAETYLPRAIVNISTVVSDCPCEEGPECTAQVFILANRSQTTLGLQLSRIKNKWTVGEVQRWWLRYEDLQARAPKMDWQDYQDAQTLLAKDFPQCVGAFGPVQITAEKK